MCFFPFSEEVSSDRQSPPSWFKIRLRSKERNISPPVIIASPSCHHPLTSLAKMEGFPNLLRCLPGRCLLSIPFIGWFACPGERFPGITTGVLLLHQQNRNDSGIPWVANRPSSFGPLQAPAPPPTGRAPKGICAGLHKPGNPPSHSTCEEPGGKLGAGWTTEPVGIEYPHWLVCPSRVTVPRQWHGSAASCQSTPLAPGRVRLPKKANTGIGSRGIRMQNQDF